MRPDLQRYLTRVATKPTPWTDEDRKALGVLSRFHMQGAGAPPFVVRHLTAHGITITETSQSTN